MTSTLSLLRAEKYRWFVFPIALFIITRVLLTGAAYIAYSANQERLFNEKWVAEHSKPPLPQVPLKKPLKPRAYLPIIVVGEKQSALITMWSQWDTNHYRNVVLKGYQFDAVLNTQPGNWSEVAFFPLYPLLISALLPAINDFATTGLLVSNLCFLFALMLLYRLIYLELADHPTVQRTLVYTAIFPTAVFYNAVYTEGTFLLASVAAFYFARRRMWGLAGISGAAASATRFIGILLYGVLLLEWARACGWTLASSLHRETWQRLGAGFRQNWKGFLLIQIALMGLLGYMLFLYVQFKDPLGFLHAQAAWDRPDLISPVTTIWLEFQSVMKQSFTQGDAHLWLPSLNLLAALLGIALTPFIWRRLGESYALYTILSVLIPAATGTLYSFARYVVVIFPIFAMLGIWGRNSLVDRSLIIGFSLFLGILTSIFVIGGFIG